MKFVSKLNSEVTTKKTVHGYVFLVDTKFELSEDWLTQLHSTTFINSLLLVVVVVLVVVVDCTQGREILCTGGDHGNSSSRSSQHSGSPLCDGNVRVCSLRRKGKEALKIYGDGERMFSSCLWESSPVRQVGFTDYTVTMRNPYLEHCRSWLIYQ
jgi:hypothetical protein